MVIFAFVVVLLVGIVLGLAWRGIVLVGDRRILDRLSAGIESEQRMRAVTHAAMQASRDAVRDSQFGRRSSSGL